MSSEDQAFPRGGGRALSGLERKRLRHEAEADARRDFLTDFESAPGSKRRKGKNVIYTHSLTYQNLWIAAAAFAKLTGNPPSDADASLCVSAT